MARLLLIALLVSACAAPAPTRAPTPAPDLTASLWVDFPALPVSQEQAANIVVNDLGGAPVDGATAMGMIESDGYAEKITFPLTDSAGRARLRLPLPAITANQAFIVTVRVVDPRGRWDEASATFEVYP